MSNYHQRGPRRFRAPLSLSLAALLAAGSALAQPASDESVITMSPFTVDTDADTGWVASNSLAGSRMNTPLRDTGASISVLTSEFLADLGAIDVAEAVEYAVNMHLTDTRENSTNDNFILETFDVGRLNIRGIPATATRNYYRWNLQSDSYNVDRIEENRGPNSILFGIGSAGGVINTMTKRAVMGRDFRKATLAGGSYDFYRGTVDINQTLTEKWALRLNGVYSDQGSFRHHKQNDTRRIHLASTYQLLPKTQIRVDFETGTIDQVTARGFPGADAVTRWFDAGSPIVGGPQPADASLGIGRLNTSQMRFTYIENSGEAINMRGANRSQGTGYSILNTGIADYSVNPGGPGSVREADLSNVTVFLEQQFGDRTFVELSHNRQYFDSLATINGQGRSENSQLFGDPNQFLPNGDPNPNVGRLFFEGGRMNRILVDNETHASRLMISHELDLGKWGNYRMAGLGEYEFRNEKRNVLVEVWEGSPFHSAPENQQNHVYRRRYVTTGDWSTYYFAGPGETGLLQNIPHPTKPGETLNSHFVPFNKGGQRDPEERQTTYLAGLQARYLNDRLVFGLGYRRDKLDVRTIGAVRDPVTNFWTVADPDAPVVEQEFTGNTRTLGVVGHVTDYLSLFYNFSNSLNLPNTGHRILPDSLPPPMADAQGQDYGFTLSFFNNRLVARANYFEVDLLNATGGGFGGTFSNPTVLTNNVLDALLAAEEITQPVADEHRIDTNQAIRNQRLEGYEFNLTGNVTENWRITASYSYTDGFDSNIGPEVKEWAEDAIPFFLQWPDVMTTVTQNGELMNVRERVELWQRNAATEWLREGDKILGNRKHKYSLFTRYTFDGGPLDGLFVGGGYRYQGKAPTNFSSDGELLFSNTVEATDVLVGYRVRQFWFLRDGFRIQLNVKNVFDQDPWRITRYHNTMPQNIQRVQLNEPRTWRLTMSFDF